MTDRLIPISEREFRIYALALQPPSLVDVLDFENGWKSADGSCAGAVLGDGAVRRILALRRQVDARFRIVGDEPVDRGASDVKDRVKAAMRIADPPEPLEPGTKRRPLLLDLEGRTPNEYFTLLTQSPDHRPALLALGEVYLAMPRPDDNFVPDFQTANFESRLWELYLLAAFREQGIAVFQDEVSPDFRLERAGHSAHVEAVTANATGARPNAFAAPQPAPTDLLERLLGAPAERFAKTLRSKLQRGYHNLPHVEGGAFALAVSDFHAPSSMTWSREALASYLYGSFPLVTDGSEGRTAAALPVERLVGPQSLPAGLFRDPAMSFLSAVIFSNAATIAKFNRMGMLAGWRLAGVQVRREGVLVDRMPGALEGIPFDMNILSGEYRDLWPPDGEHWCVELEVYHNPSAAHPLAFDLLPGATHWFEADGEVRCQSFWKNSVLSSITLLLRHAAGGQTASGCSGDPAERSAFMSRPAEADERRGWILDLRLAR